MPTLGYLLTVEFGGDLGPTGNFDADTAKCRLCTSSPEDTEPVVIGEDGLCDDCRANAEDDSSA